MSKWYPCVYCTEDLRCTKYSEPGYKSWCVLGPCTAETKSNADRIRAMSDEELAELLQPTTCPTRLCPKDTKVKNCYACWLTWLQSPVKED